MRSILTLDRLPAGEACTYMAWRYTRVEFPAPHTHTFHELFWVEAGLGRYWINGDTHPLRSGDLVLVRADDYHAFAAAEGSDGFRFVNFAFHTDLWDELRARYFPSGGRFFAEEMYEKRMLRLDEIELGRVRALAADLHAGARDRLAAEAFLLGLLSMLHHPSETTGNTHLPEWLATACRQIRLHVNFVGGPAAFVRLTGKTAEHVARACRRFFGKRPCDLVNEARMEFAARELIVTERSILDVAYDCGYDNLGHFYELFRSKFGCPPGEYRVRNRGEREFA